MNKKYSIIILKNSNHFKYLYYFIFIMLIVFGCEKEKITPRDYTRVKTYPVQNISPTGATFKGEVTWLGNTPIIEHGFLWDTIPNLQYRYTERYSLGEKSGTGVFYTDIKANLKANKLYYTCAFANDGARITYGEVTIFESLGSLGPDINDFNPKTATWLDTITVKGKNFSVNAKNNLVQLGKIEASPFEANDTLLRFVVPAVNNFEKVNISVSTVGNITISTDSFTYATPFIQDFSPNNGTDFTKVTINGKYFIAEPKYNTVQFDEINAEVLSATKTKLEVIVPAGLNKKNATLSISVGNKVGIASKPFIMIAPEITDFEPKEGAIGELITIKGNNFGTLKKSNQVYFDTVKATIKQVSQTEIVVVVPYVFTAKTKIKVVSFEQETSSNSYFSFYAPKLESINPAKAGKGTLITLSGDNFSAKASDHSVFFDNVEGKIISSSKNQITVTVPNEITKRHTTITVNTSQHKTTPVDFEFVGGTWTTEGTKQTDYLYGGVSFIIGDIVYIGLGRHTPSDNPYPTDFWSYNMATGEYKKLQDFPSKGREFCVSFAINGKGYVGLGSLFTTYYNDFWEFDPVTQNWTQLPDFPGKGRVQAASFAINESAYIGLGINFEGYETDFYRFNTIDKTWSKISDFPGIESHYVSSFVIGELGYVGLGNRGGNFLKEFYRYNPANDQWTALSNFPFEGDYVDFSISLNNHGYTGLMEYDDIFHNYVFNCYEYDPEFDTWHKTESPPSQSGNLDFPAFLYNQKAYIVYPGLINDNVRCYFEIFEPIN